MGVALNLASAISGNSIKTHETCPIQTKSNIFVMICGPSNSGKTTIINYGIEVLEKAQYRNMLTDDFTSESLAQHFASHPYANMRTDEITKFISGYRKKTYLAGTRESLIKAYDGLPLIQIRATRTVVEARDYALSCIADTQPIVIAEEAGESDVQSGYLPRHIWFNVLIPDPVKPQQVSKDIIFVRDDLIKSYSKIHKFLLANDVQMIFADAQIKQIHDRLSPHQSTEHVHFQPFYHRITQFAYKIAMLYEIAESDFLERFESSEDLDEEEWQSDQRSISNKKVHQITISNASVSWSIEFMQKYLTENLPKTLKILRLSNVDKVVNVIERYRDTHNSAMPESLLYRSLSNVLKEKRVIENAIDLATKCEFIQLNKVQGGVNYSLYGEFTPKKVEHFANKENDDDSQNQEGDGF